MNKKRAEQFVKQRADELRSLGRILLEADLVRDAEPLHRAAASCELARNVNGYHWRYDLHRLQFQEIDLGNSRIRHSRPRSLAAVEIYLDVAVGGECLDDGACEDPLRELVAGFQIEGFTVKGDVLTCAWHFDRHGFDNAVGEQSEEGESHFAHPGYHFQFGGREVWSKADEEFGSHLLLEPPRIAHPPLDAILAVDFVISNYFGPIWRELKRQSGIYNELLRESQSRLWKPYALATSDYWERPPYPAWDAQWIWPQLFSFDTGLPAS